MSWTGHDWVETKKGEETSLWQFPGQDTFIVYFASRTIYNSIYINLPGTQPPCHHQPAGRRSRWRTWNFEQSWQYRYTNRTRHPLLKLVWGGWSGPWAAAEAGWFNTCLICRVRNYKYQKSIDPKMLSWVLPSSAGFQAQLAGWYSRCYKLPAPVTYCRPPGMLHTHRHRLRLFYRMSIRNTV